MKILKFFKFNISKEQNKRIFKNFTSLISLNASLTIWQILFPPLMIMIYGLENFGIWIFLTAIPSSLAILNFNFNAAAKTEMSMYFNQNNKNKVNEIFNNSIVLNEMEENEFQNLPIIISDTKELPDEKTHTIFLEKNFDKEHQK